jgi:hypothetical protein
MIDIGTGWAVVMAGAHCSNHQITVPFTEADVAACVYFEATCSHGTASAGTLCHDYCDTGSSAILVLKDGRWCRATESSDTSGHG